MTSQEPEPKKSRWLRFILVGGVNTLFTYGVYIALNTILNYHVAYLIAYTTGIVFSYYLNSVIVFKTPLSWKSFYAYPLVYAFQYGSSALLLGILIEFANINESIAPLFVTILTIPLTYLMSKAILSWPHKSDLTKKQHITDNANSNTKK